MNKLFCEILCNKCLVKYFNEEGVRITNENALFFIGELLFVIFDFFFEIRETKSTKIVSKYITLVFEKTLNK